MTRTSLRIIFCITALMLATAFLFACKPSYKVFHTKENMLGRVTVDGSKLTAYFFLIEDGSAVLDICNTEEKTVQQILFPLKGEYYASLDFEYAFSYGLFQDMNFDGYQDLYIPCSVTTENLQGMAWLWDTEEESFVLSHELSSLYELTVFPEEKLITSQDYTDPEKILCKEFAWENGKLLQVGEYTVSQGDPQ